jgi:hypothetical protein
MLKVGDVSLDMTGMKSIRRKYVFAHFSEMCEGQLREERFRFDWESVVVRCLGRRSQWALTSACAIGNKSSVGSM